MKHVTIIRHAEAGWGDEDTRDFDRPLNRRGLRSASRMAARIKDRGVRFEMLLASPAKRTRQTSTAFQKCFRLAPSDVRWCDEIYSATSDHLMDQLASLEDEIEHAGLIGHNPGVTDLANRLRSNNLAPITFMPPCGIVCVTLDIPHWFRLADGVGARMLTEFP